MFSFKEFPTTASASATALFSAYASVAASMMLVRSMANEIVPAELRHHISAAVRRLFTPLSADMTVVVDEYSGMSRNEIFEAAELYLRSKIPSSASRLRVAKLPRQKSIAVAAENGEKIPDEFEGIKLTWQLVCSEAKKNSPQREERQLEVSFDKKFKNRVLDSYLPYVLLRARSMRLEDRVIKLYSRDGPLDHDYDGCRGGVWGSVNLEHPATFDTVAMDPELKRSVVEDLDRFLRRKDFYKKVGKAWKRGYLLYGPPGTGKSSLIAAMANYLKFDVYDVELNSIYSNAELRRTLLATSNRSILVIEDIDCSVDLKSRYSDSDPDGLCDSSNLTKFTLSGLLNFIDGLWSSCGDERIIVFTTNHKDRLDPALLRPGRMDVHINMSYCTKHGFRTLASNYLGLQGSDRPLCQEIEGLIGVIDVTPAEIAEELMRSDDVDVALKGLVDFLKRKRTEKEQPNEKTENVDVIEPRKSKRVKMSPNLMVCRNIEKRVVKKRRFLRR